MPDFFYAYSGMFDDDFQFSDKPKEFWAELQVIIFAVACNFQQESLESLTLEACFTAGKHVERLYSEGYRWSDTQSDTASTLKKSSPSDEQLIESYKKAIEKQKKSPVKRNRFETVKRDLAKIGCEIGSSQYFERIKKLRAKGLIV